MGAPKVERITAEQRKAIFGIAKNHGIGEGDLYAMVYSVSRGDSIGALSKEQAKRLIDRLKEVTGDTTGMKSRKMASREQVWKLRELEKALGWQDNPRRLKAFCKKYAGVEVLEWLTAAKAWRLIESLKKMLEKTE